ncbi:MAG: thiamine-phosphate kinase [Gemmatimonadota bacterium]
MSDSPSRPHDGNPHQAMGPGREFDTIRGFMSRWGALAVGIGDDAALLHAPPGRTLVASTDACVEGAHFREGWLSPAEIGARATAAALSDLAAMGARADAILIAFVVPDTWRARLDEVADGIAQALAPTGARIAGGNISRGSAFSITTTVIGSAPQVIPRSGARPGDVLLVTGLLGGPGGALRAWEEGRTPTVWARERFARPVPRLEAGQIMANAGVHAMLDISDGLAADARHMAAASNVVLTIDPALLPCGPGVSPADALVSGEEYELLVACPPEIVTGMLTEIRQRFALPVTIVGKVEAGPGSVQLSADGMASPSERFTDARRVEFGAGHDHFSG